MKKIVSIILLSSVLLTGNVTFAQASPFSNVKSKISQPLSDREDKEDKKDKLAEMAPLQETIRSNRTKLLNQRATARDAYNKAKAHVKELIKDKDNLTPERIEAIKAAVEVLKQDQHVIAGTLGNIQKETLGLRTAKQGKNFDGFINSLSNISAVQNTRIGDLQKVIDDLNRIASL